MRAILYVNLNDRIPENRTLIDAVKIVADLNPDFIWMGFEYGAVLSLPESEETAYKQYLKAGYPPKVAERLAAEAKKRGYHYKSLRDQITKLKKVLPHVDFNGAIHPQYVYYHMWNDITLKPYSNDEIESMVLDLSKWGLPYDKRRTQEMFRKFIGYGFYSDLTNEEFQRLILSRVKRFADCGVDSIWYDMLFAQALLIYRYVTKDAKHKAVTESFEAAVELIYKTKKYVDKVGTWSGFLFLKHINPNLPSPEIDFITENPQPNEVRNLRFNKNFWIALKRLRDKFIPSATVMVTPDWGPGCGHMMNVFSQELTPQQQCQFMRIWKDFCDKMGFVPVFPVHGGNLGEKGKCLKKMSYGKYNKYDALAPEFNTYDCIKSLMVKDYKVLLLAAIIGAILAAIGLGRWCQK